MHPYIEINTHHIGTSHLQNHLDCEDFSASYADENISIAVISDGHGDKNCFRSKIGAKIACETAITLCRQFQVATDQILDVEQCDFNELLQSLENELVDTWKMKVLQDAEQHPFLDDELAQASTQAQETYKSGSRIEKAYGCTLIIAVLTRNYWYAIQIGDGKCVAAFEDGVFVEPIPTDEENCCGNRSTSLCNSNAKELFRHYYNNQLPLATFVVSDGVEESFDQSGLYNCFFSVAYWVKDSGIEIASQKLNELLPQISAGGSGDDVSISALISSEVALSKPRQTLEQVYEKVCACKDTMERYSIALSNSSEELLEKKKSQSSIDEKILDFENKIKELKENKEKLENQCLEIEKKQADLKVNQEKAAEQMEKAYKYQTAAETFWIEKLKSLSIPIPNEDDHETETIILKSEELIEEVDLSNTAMNASPEPENEAKNHENGISESEDGKQEPIDISVDEILDEITIEGSIDAPSKDALVKFSSDEWLRKTQEVSLTDFMKPTDIEQADKAKRWHLFSKKTDKNERR